MAKLCPQCGVKYANNAPRCIICNTEFPDNHAYNQKKKLLIFGLLSIILVGIALSLVMMLTGPKACIRRIMEAYKRNDPEAIVATFPDFFLASNRLDRDTLEFEVKINANELSEFIHSYNIEDVKDPTSQNREELLESFRYYGGNDFNENDITEIKIIWVNYKGNVSGVWSSNAARFTMIKYQGRWHWWPDTINR